MTTVQPYLTDAFAGLHVLVIGETILDSYLKGGSDRLCREAPVPIVTLEECDYIPGGAANTAVNIRSLGGQVSFVSVVGDDREGELVQEALAERQVSLDNVICQRGRKTLAKQRIISAGQIMLRFDHGTTTDLDSSTEDSIIERLRSLLPGCDAVLISNYAYGVLTPRILQAIEELQQQSPRVLAVDSKRLTDYRRMGVTVMKPNYQEVIHLLGIPRAADPRRRAEQLMPHEQRLLDLTGAQIVTVTLDEDGAIVFEQGNEPYRTYTRPSPNSRAAGAGDTYISALTLALCAGAQTPTAAELASAAAEVVVSKEGTSACSLSELREYLSSTSAYVEDIERLLEHVDYCRQRGRRIVFTNGCFDILHRGHINYLNRAKSLGDLLIVGLNSDQSIRRLKGDSRPINTLDDRAQVMAALSCIDYIISFDEDTPVHLIEQIRPDIFVKGGDYTRETLPEADVVEAYGGNVQILPYLEDFSTSNMIERIREVYARPVSQEEARQLLSGGG